MIGTLILFLVIIVFLAFFVGKNLLNVCTIWFFKDFTDISVAMLVFVAFGAGIVFSLLLLFVSRMKKLFKSEEDASESDVKSHKIQKAEAKMKSSKEKKLAKISKKNKKWSTNKEEAALNSMNSDILTESAAKNENPTE